MIGLSNCPVVWHRVMIRVLCKLESIGTVELAPLVLKPADKDTPPLDESQEAINARVTKVFTQPAAPAKR